MATDITQERLNEIVAEVFTIAIEAQRSDEWDALDKLLLDVMDKREQFDTLELSMYLRAAGNFKHNLPTWQSLFDEAIRLCRERGDAEDGIFYGFDRSKCDTM